MLKAYIVIVLIIFTLMVFGVPVWEIKMMVYAGFGIAILKVILDIKDINRVERAELIEEIAVYKKVAERTGFSVSWDWRHGRDYYRYKNVIDHYKCVFSVVYKDGSTGTIRCRKYDYKYNKLIRKI